MPGRGTRRHDPALTQRRMRGDVLAQAHVKICVVTPYSLVHRQLPLLTRVGGLQPSTYGRPPEPLRAAVACRYTRVPRCAVSLYGSAAARRRCARGAWRRGSTPLRCHDRLPFHCLLCGTERFAIQAAMRCDFGLCTILGGERHVCARRAVHGTQRNGVCSDAESKAVTHRHASNGCGVVGGGSLAADGQLTDGIRRHTRHRFNQDRKRG